MTETPTGPVPGTDYSIRDASGDDLYAFLGILARAATASETPPAAGADAAGIVGLVVSSGLYGELAALVVERQDGTRLGAEAAAAEVPAFVVRAALVAFYAEAAQLAQLLAGGAVTTAETGDAD